ncbi:MAG: hypothetical protein JNM93_01205 [Bacteriovoracaceae bacterium]|nr:hypothetical protein [Bacteriovoracaceae bacterium]
MFKSFLVILFFIIISIQANADLREASRIYSKGKIGVAELGNMIKEFVDSGYTIAALPWMKEYLVSRGPMRGKIEDVFEQIILDAGVKSFQVLPPEVLENSRSPSIYYVLAKIYFSRGQFNMSLKYLDKIETGDKIYPYASHMKGVIHSSEGRFDVAEGFFKDCINYSNKYASDTKTKAQAEQLQMNHDYCLAGVARNLFAKEDYKKSDLAYLDIQKKAYIWPEILFEEAWNSFYQGNYNRTLGKLVTYRAPIFSHVFKPEAQALVAMSYLKLCLYKDAQRSVDEFYATYLEPARFVRKFLLNRKSDYNYYYDLAIGNEKSRTNTSELLANILDSISMEPAYREIKETMKIAFRELKLVKNMAKSKLQRAMYYNLVEVINSQKIILGSYVRNRAIAKYAELYRAFQDMSYIKLEVLAQRKQRLYESRSSQDDKRGSVNYVERNDKQYFWTFNGEFWADELGDYVFALPSEC